MIVSAIVLSAFINLIFHNLATKIPEQLSFGTRDFIKIEKLEDSISGCLEHFPCGVYVD